MSRSISGEKVYVSTDTREPNMYCSKPHVYMFVDLSGHGPLQDAWRVAEDN
jgi:hypothetical protein